MKLETIAEVHACCPKCFLFRIMANNPCNSNQHKMIIIAVLHPNFADEAICQNVRETTQMRFDGDIVCQVVPDYESALGYASQNVTECDCPLLGSANRYQREKNNYNDLFLHSLTAKNNQKLKDIKNKPRLFETHSLSKLSPFLIRAILEFYCVILLQVAPANVKFCNHSPQLTG
jgi:hypothetical protein